MKYVLNEQSTDPCSKKYQYKDDLTRDGFIPTDNLPSGFVYNKTEHCFKIFQSITWYRRKDGKPIGQSNQSTQTIDGINNYVGIYRLDSSPFVKGRIKNINGKLNIDFKLPVVGDLIEELTFVSGTTFNIKSGVLIFNPDSTGNITSLKFSLKYGSLNVDKNAIKIDSNPDADIKKDDKKTDSTDDDKKSDTTTNNDSGKTVITKYDPVTNKHEGLTTKKCDNFPFTMGCINPKIGVLNNIYFGDPMDNIYSKVLYNALRSDANFGMPNEKDGVISQTLYDRVIKNSQKQNESVVKKTIIKQSVKKVLKERFNKK
jgi:hypothetical protein